MRLGLRKEPPRFVDKPEANRRSIPHLSLKKHCAMGKGARAAVAGMHSTDVPFDLGDGPVNFID